jgi:class 3 adenylate cyclase/alpha-beta hydrolase superfamily lysophospholipase
MSDFTMPRTRYAMNGTVSIAYHVMGDEPIDVVMVPGAISHIEGMHELPGYTAYLQRLSKFARVMIFDKRGQGLSDRMTDAPSLEQRMDDIRAVMDAADSKRATVIGFSEGASMSAVFAATYPERVAGLILYGGMTEGTAVRGEELAVLEKRVAQYMNNWGDGAFMKRAVSASQPVSAEIMERFGRLERMFISPGALKANVLLNAQIDVKPILGSVRVPTLVLHRRTDAFIPFEQGRALAEHIPGARFIQYPDGDHGFWTGDTDAPLGDIEEFVTGRRNGAADLDRILATVLFTDIAGSTQSAVQLGDQRWRRLLDEHDRLGRQMVERHRGKLVKMTGDGILATFDGPARAVRCSLAFSSVARDIGVPMRAGLHTGEIETRGRDVGGIAVHAAARVMGHSQPGEVLVSRVVTDLVAGAGLRFSERGSHELKGLPGAWELFAASSS